MLRYVQPHRFLRATDSQANGNIYQLAQNHGGDEGKGPDRGYTNELLAQLQPIPQQ
jgi:hypothetical protein